MCALKRGASAEQALWEMGVCQAEPCCLKDAHILTLLPPHGLSKAEREREFECPVSISRLRGIFFLCFIG